MDEVEVEQPLPVQEDESNDESSDDLKDVDNLKRGHGEHDDFSLDRFPVRETVFRLPGFKESIALNPVVSLIGFFFLWGLAIWCMAAPTNALTTLVNWRGKVSLYFTWLFIGSKCAFFFFLLYIVFKFGHVKLGKKDEPPEFTTAAYFAMIFAAGVAVGLFVFGVSEPLWHRASHYYAEGGYRSQDDIDMFAINMTVTNWAIAGWSPYLIVAVCMGLATFRFEMPTTFRSCFYPILGEYTWGWIGDILDGYAIVVTVAGVCTSLGLGAITIVTGFQVLGWVDDDISEDRTTAVQNITVWVITCIATISVVTGLDVGIKYLSMFAFGLGMLLLWLVFVLDNTKFLLNLQVQEVGYFLQWSILQINFWTDAFGQLTPGEGRATDGNAAESWWMNAWVIFYQAWWVSWACFVGLFVARISRGRTIAEVIIYSLVAPILYCIMWFSVWGGAGMRQARQAEELIKIGEDYFNDADYYLHPGSPNCYDVPQGRVFDAEGNQIFGNQMLGVTPVCTFLSSESGLAAYNVLYSFSYPESFGGQGLGPALSVVFVVSLAIYFATSSDSGSLIVDHMAANGRQKHHWLQRVFWAFTEGALATALLTAGGSDALSALQAGSIVAGLPFCLWLCYLMPCIYLFCQKAEESESMVYTFPDQNEFSVPVYGGVFNIMETIFSLGDVNQHRIDRKMDKPTSLHVTEFLKGVFVPSIPLYQVLSETYPSNGFLNMLVTGLYTVFYYLWIALFASIGTANGLVGVGWTFFFIAGFTLGAVRGGFREHHNIRSNIVGDYLSSLFFWPQVLTQMRQHCVDVAEGAEEPVEAVEQ